MNKGALIELWTGELELASGAMNVFDQLEAFLYSHLGETWHQAAKDKIILADNIYRLEVAFTGRWERGKVIQCLDIPILIVGARHWRLGHCKRFIQFAHEHNPWQYTVIESPNSIITSRLPLWGFTYYGQGDYYKATGK